MAKEATGAERERLFARGADRFPDLAKYPRKTDRVITVIVLTPLAVLPADARMPPPSPTKPRPRHCDAAGDELRGAPSASARIWLYRLATDVLLEELGGTDESRSPRPFDGVRDRNEPSQ